MKENPAKNNIIFVTGFFGAPVMQSARQLAESRGFGLISLDAEIEKSDGRPVRRICMMMGEHEYRNKEYEALKEIISRFDDVNTCADECCINDNESTDRSCSNNRNNECDDKNSGSKFHSDSAASNKEALPADFENPDDCHSGLVVCCGDGVLHDDMSRELILQHELVIIGTDMTCDELWENAKNIDNSCHAFMYFGTEGEKSAAFAKLYERQRELFMPYI